VGRSSLAPAGESFSGILSRPAVAHGANFGRTVQVFASVLWGGQAPTIFRLWRNEKTKSAFQQTWLLLPLYFPKPRDSKPTAFEDIQVGEWTDEQAGFSSGQSRDRTGDTRIFSPVLYQLSYLSVGSATKPLREEVTAAADSFQGHGGNL
jgi:hypothetical protein